MSRIISDNERVDEISDKIKNNIEDFQEIISSIHDLVGDLEEQKVGNFLTNMRENIEDFNYILEREVVEDVEDFDLAVVEASNIMKEVDETLIKD